MVRQPDEQSKGRDRRELPPQLVAYGPVAKLTQGGATSLNSDSGHNSISPTGLELGDGFGPWEGRSRLFKAPQGETPARWLRAPSTPRSSILQTGSCVRLSDERAHGLTAWPVEKHYGKYHR